MTSLLDQHVAQMAAASPHAAIAAMAETLHAAYPDAQAIIAYGSAIRDSNPENTLMDFYVLTQSLEGVSTHALSRKLCRLAPPNVYYAEVQVNSRPYRCKYAVLPMELLARKVKATTSNPYFWVRFAQPSLVVWSRDKLAHQRILQILVRAMETAYAHARELAPEQTSLERWVTLFRNTYKTELRPENEARAALIVNAHRQHFETIAKYADTVTPAAMPWSVRRWQGKALSIVRLSKAAFTFQGGADYAAWKIKRHSGVDIEIKAWHRRHPILASIILLPKLLRKGGLK